MIKQSSVGYDQALAQVNAELETNQTNGHIPNTRYEYAPEQKQRLLTRVNSKIVRASQLEHMEIPATTLVIPGMIPEGLVPIGASSKTGKSCFTLSAAYDITEGLPILGKIENEKPRKVLYMTLEDPYSVTLPRYDAYRQDRPRNDNLIFADSWDLIDPASDGVAMLDVFLETEPDVVWVIIDVQQKVMPFMVDDSTMYARLYELLPPLKQLGYHHHVAISPTMHTRKSNGKPITLEDIYGSQGYTANADAILLIDTDYKPPHHRRLNVFGKGPGIRERRDIPLDFDMATERYTLGDGQEVETIQQETKKADAKSKLDLLLSWASKMPGIKPKKYKEVTQQSENAVYSQINDAFTKKKICKDEDNGMYPADSDKCRELADAFKRSPDYDPE